MDAQGIDVEALSINPYWYTVEHDLARQIILHVAAHCVLGHHWMSATRRCLLWRHHAGGRGSSGTGLECRQAGLRCCQMSRSLSDKSRARTPWGRRLMTRRIMAP